MTQIIAIRSPKAKLPEAVAPRAGKLGKPIRNMRVGIRTDTYWQSWLWVSDEWSTLLKDEGATPVMLRVGVHVGEEGENTKDLVDVWASSVDCAVVGLAN